VTMVSIPYKETGLENPRTTDQANILAQQVVDGKISIYKFYYVEPLAQFGGTVEKNLLQKEGEDFYEPRFFLFKKDMADYLCDCPTLIDKIENHQYKRKDMKELITDYNMLCGY
jgi:hypothetical protein